MRYKVAVSILTFVCIGGWYIFSKQSTSASEAFCLRVGTAAGYAPFVSINEQGEYEGFDIDVINAVAQQMGRSLVLHDLGSMTALFTSLQQGTIDVIIWGLSITQERCEKVAMIHYQGQLTSSYQLIFWDTLPKGVRVIDDMSGMTVCVEPHSAQDAVMRSYPSIAPLYTEKVDDALLNIQYGKADAAFVEPAIAKKFKNKYSNIQILDVPLRPDDYVQGIGIVVRKEDKELIASLRQAVESVKATGTLTALECKWDVAS